MDPRIIRQYISGLQGAKNPFLMENSRFLGNLPENIVYNGLLYTYNLRENAFINQFGHRIDPSAAPAFITEAKAFEQQNLAILDISSSSSDNSSSRPRPSDDVASIKNPNAEPRPESPRTEVIVTWSIDSGQESKTDGYVLLRSTDPKGPFTEVKTSITPETRVFIDTGLTPNTTYYYQVAATLGGKEGPLSTVVSAKTSSVTPPAVGITAPSGLTATRITQSAIDLAWVDNSTNELGFYLYESLNGSTFSIIEVLGIGATTASVKGLTQDRNYWYRVQAFATGSTSAFSNTVALRTLPTIPTAPSNLSLLVGGTSQIQVSWTDNSNNEQFFNVFRSTDGVSYPFGITLPAGSTTYLNTGLSAGTTYFYRVNAANTGGTSGFAGPVSATTLGITIAAPTLLSAYSSVPATKNFLRYTEGFTTAVSLANGGWTSTSGGSSTTVSIDNSILAPNGTTGAALLTVNSPVVIGGIHSIISEPGITANDYWSGSVWLRGKTATIGGINVVVRSSSNQNLIPSTLKILSGPGTVVTSSVGEPHWNGVVGLSKTEWTRVAWNNTSPWGITGSGGTYTDVLLRLTVNFYDGSIPSAVTGDSIYAWGAQFERNPYPTEYLAATGGSFSERPFQGLTSQINLYWQDNSTDETGFSVERSTTLGGVYSGITLLPANTTIYSDRGLSSGSTYFYRVSSFKTGATSGFAGPTSAVTYPTIPTAPSNLRFTDRTTGKLALAWNDNSNNETGFVIESSLNGSSYNFLNTVGANVTGYDVGGLSAGTTYFFQVAAFNAGGTSAFSGATSWQTLPNAPATPTFTSILAGSSSQININWTNVANETGYNLYRSLNDVSYTGITTLGSDVTGFTNSGLSAGTTYFYKIEAFNSGGTSALSGSTSATTLPAGTTPSAPTGFTALSATDSTVTLQWTDTSTNEDGFLIYYRGIT
jgi:titin